MAVVARQELRDLWIGGRGLVLAFAFSILLSAITYLGATNQALNFLERREAVNLTLQVAVGVGALLALLAAADAISGERERGTLESLLLTPVGARGSSPATRRGAVAVARRARPDGPYVWFLGHDVARPAKRSGRARSPARCRGGLNGVRDRRERARRLQPHQPLGEPVHAARLFAPTQLPAGAQHGWAGEALLRVNPVTAAEHYVGAVVVDQHGWTRDLSWLASPLIAAVALTVVAVAVMPRFLRLRGGVGGWARRLRAAAACALAALCAAPAAAAPELSMSRARVSPASARTSASAPRSRTPVPRPWRASSPISTSSAAIPASTSTPRTGRRSARATCRPWARRLDRGPVDREGRQRRALRGLRRRPGRRPAARGTGARRAGRRAADHRRGRRRRSRSACRACWGWRCSACARGARADAAISGPA